MAPIRSHIPLQGQRHIQLPQQPANIQVMEPQIKLVPYNQSCIMQSQRSKMEDIAYQQNTTT